MTETPFRSDDPDAYAARLAATKYTQVCPVCGERLADWTAAPGTHPEIRHTTNLGPLPAE